VGHIGASPGLSRDRKLNVERALLRACRHVSRRHSLSWTCWRSPRLICLERRPAEDLLEEGYHLIRRDPLRATGSLIVSSLFISPEHLRRHERAAHWRWLCRYCFDADDIDSKHAKADLTVGKLRIETAAASDPRKSADPVADVRRDPLRQRLIRPLPCRRDLRGDFIQTLRWNYWRQ